MKYDCGFTKDNYWYRYRTGAFLVYDNKMLFVKSSIGEYYYLVGGGVHLGETSVNCMEREVLEETGMKAKARHLSVVCENFFKGHGGIIDGKDCHTIEFYYYMKCSDEEINHCKTQTDKGEELVWIPLDEVENAVIKPTFIIEKLHEIVSSAQTIHIIEERDR